LNLSGQPTLADLLLQLSLSLLECLEHLEDLLLLGHLESLVDLLRLSLLERLLVQ
jgi:hypothetical protein